MIKRDEAFKRCISAEARITDFLFKNSDNVFTIEEIIVMTAEMDGAPPMSPSSARIALDRLQWAGTIERFYVGGRSHFGYHEKN